MLIFKTQRSGSSWMTSQINTYDGVFLQEEIIRGESRNIGDPWKEALSYVVKSLSSPTPTWGEHWRKGKKPTGDFQVLGGTVNALYVSQYVNFQKLAEIVPNLRLVLYTRTNRIKQAISFARGTELWEKCNKRVVTFECKLDTKFELDINELPRHIQRAVGLEKYMIKEAWAVAAKLDN